MQIWCLCMPVELFRHGKLIPFQVGVRLFPLGGLVGTGLPRELEPRRFSGAKLKLSVRKLSLAPLPKVNTKKRTRYKLGTYLGLCKCRTRANWTPGGHSRWRWPLVPIPLSSIPTLCTGGNIKSALNCVEFLGVRLKQRTWRLSGNVDLNDGHTAQMMLLWRRHTLSLQVTLTSESAPVSNNLYI